MAKLQKTRVIRLRKREGLIRTRLAGAREAKGEILIFFDSHIEVNTNWLPPLIEPIALNYKTSVCPFIDIVKWENFAYIAQDEGRRSKKTTLTRPRLYRCTGCLWLGYVLQTTASPTRPCSNTGRTFRVNDRNQFWLRYDRVCPFLVIQSWPVDCLPSVRNGFGSWADTMKVSMFGVVNSMKCLSKSGNAVDVWSMPLAHESVISTASSIHMVVSLSAITYPE